MKAHKFLLKLHIVSNLVLTLILTICVLNIISILPVEGQNSSLPVKIVPGASNPKNNLWYDPQIKIIKPGENVTWINKDSSLHTVTNGTFYTGPLGTYDSGILNSEQESRPWIFVSPGTFNYYCTLHPFMSGQILVQ